ncbi:hypothetical protein E4U54_001404, partial [Claviceps lovelessii]
MHIRVMLPRCRAVLPGAVPADDAEARAFIEKSTQMRITHHLFGGLPMSFVAALVASDASGRLVASPVLPFINDGTGVNDVGTDVRAQHLTETPWTSHRGAQR